MGEYIIKLPDVGEGIAEAEIVDWHVQVGDQVNEDDILVSVMTDKATVELPSPVTGQVAWLGCAVGETLAIGSPLVKLEVAGENSAESVPEVRPAATAAPKTPAVTAPQTPAAPEPLVSRKVDPRPPARFSGAPRAEGEKPLAAPAVRERARRMGVDLRLVPGTGPAGRISHDDLETFARSGGSPQRGRLVADTSIREVKVIGLRRKIAEKMQDAKQRIAHFSYVEEVDVTELENLRGQLNSSRREDQPKLTLLPFLMQALIKALKFHPMMSAHYDDAKNIVYQYGAAHIGIAAQTPQGLVVPVVRHAEARDLWDCAAEVNRLAAAAKAGKARSEELTGSTITISSLGPLGGIVSTPVINAPEVAIIGVNKIAIRPVYQNGVLVPRKIMNLSSSFDHRIVDGVDAAEFIQRLKAQLEHPALMLMEN